MTPDLIELVAYAIGIVGSGIAWMWLRTKWFLDDRRKDKFKRDSQFRYTVVERDDLLREFTLGEFRKEAKISNSLESPFYAESCRDAVRKHVYTTFDVDGWGDLNGELQEGVKIVFEEGPDRFVLVPWIYDPSPYPGAEGHITISNETSFPGPCTSKDGKSSPKSYK